MAILSGDTDANHRKWRALGYGSKTSPTTSWRYWRTETGCWIISAPNGMAEFEQRDKTVLYQGRPIIEGKTQWEATWLALAYFHSIIVPSLEAPPLARNVE